MKAVFSFYDPGTGLFADRHKYVHTKMIEANTPAGLVAIKGRFDPRSHRVDVATGEVVPYTPPEEPDSPALAAVKARARIRELERQSIGPIRALALDPLNLTAKQRLQAIDDEIASLEAVITLP